MPGRSTVRPAMSDFVAWCAGGSAMKLTSADDALSALGRWRNAAVIFGIRVRSAAADVATDLRHRADRSGVPLARLPLPPDQPAPHRYLRYLGRRSSRALRARLRSGAGGRGRRHRGLDHADRRSRHRHRGRWPARRPDRRAVLGHLLASPPQQSGEIVGINVAAEEITERKRAEAALRASERQFHTLAHSIPQLVWMADAKARSTGSTITGTSTRAGLPEKSTRMAGTRFSASAGARRLKTETRSRRSCRCWDRTESIARS